MEFLFYYQVSLFSLPIIIATQRIVIYQEKLIFSISENLFFSIQENNKADQLSSKT